MICSVRHDSLAQEVAHLQPARMTNVRYAPLKNLDALELHDSTALESAALSGSSSSSSPHSVWCGVVDNDWSDEERKEPETSRRLVLKDFHSHEAPTMMLSKLLISLLLRLFFPFSWWAGPC